MRALILTLTRWVVMGLAGLLIGCRSANPVAPLAEPTALKTLEVAMSDAASLNQPLAILLVELGQSRADEAAVSLLESPKLRNKTGSFVSCILDLGISRNRAIAARFHPVRTPVLVCVSPKGIIVSRDEVHLGQGLVLRRIETARRESSELDSHLASLEQVASTNSTGNAAQLELANFLLAHGNALEAIPHLAAVAHCATCNDAQRVQAWVELARAHLWIGEPEKARAEADNLVSTLGSRLPEARAGGKLILGIHDANLKRADQARREFEETMVLAPATSYANEAAAMLEDLRKGRSLK